MSKSLVIGGAVALLAAGYYLVGAPYLALHQMQAAIEEKDGQAIVDLIEFEKLRSDVKGDLMTMMAAEADDPMTAAFGGALAGGMIDSFLQPEMVAAMIGGKETKKNRGYKAPDFSDLNISTSLGFMKLTVTLESDDDKPIDIVFEPAGLTWKVVGLDFDMSDMM